MISLNFSSTGIEHKPRMKCIVRVTHSMFKTKYGYSKRTDIRDLKRKSDMSMSDIFVEDSDIGCIENLHEVEDGVYEIVPSSISYGGYYDTEDEVETWKLIKVVDTDK